MLEVVASLIRGPVFLAGETINCEVTFTNTSPDNNSGDEVLAWSSVQIICQCTVSESRVMLPRKNALSTEEVSTSGCETSFVPNRGSCRLIISEEGERGLTVLCTKPKILFCDLKLSPGMKRSYQFEEVIPTDAPPSFRGQAVKYSYKVIVGTQRLEKTTKIVRVPFRVLVLYGLNDISVYNENEEISPSNPFLHNHRKENSVLDVALQVISTVTARKAPHSYNITNARGRVAKFLLFKQAYKLGEDIVGMFDFSVGTVTCVQYSVTLQSEEQVSEECRRRLSQGTAVTSYVKHQEMCLHTVRTHMNIPIPLTATPGFMTDIVCQRWRLHFEFVTSLDEISGPDSLPNDGGERQWQGPSTLNVETMVWDLPIKIFPTNPIHASSVTLMKTTASIQMNN
ncbi:RAB6A-GEF complex partner protein 2-like isoform X1 [Biomphalaria glabrata]|uniref:RAB6A-GEF complex partner protein 2-like isoform X1 n=1 Tax=Biomphalaria glabrata TaxID=6526 RepID=A0A2C9JSQ7_BIOGL|nr:RAB6A-GEF complex partner protein 2-like isoform X1 [Biomphalaria glabrata]XP_055861614.1 RAB6A-GEF complex partner protein 2-like isoform X1 [Biomphalaria glabrata]XP_055861619.1 RAB6A-GEF complex partner protein 2-like isoform X1 [Biomphalaria glabrata]XP_055861626.1 RAB6A-GEF complex partner protein 2-like isoform X1 [Biomphalaria glabrata]XP_055861634.1 RAB6A-GEF complex partner protein 2-like isoform X1 [Biomphalaria glabrata]KAI8769145.1 RAB6A-GEF complex partner protein 2-like isofor